MLNNFIFATRNKLRFPYKGNISVEELWQLSLTELDGVYTNLSSLKESNKGKDSLLNTNKKTKDEEILDIKIEIVKYIFKVKSEEAEVKRKEQENKAKEQKILEILAGREEDSLRNMSNEELNAMLASMRK